MSKNIAQVFATGPITTNVALDLMYFGRSPYGATDDKAMTYANFALQFGAPYTASALTKTDDTNVTVTLGGTPATALLQAVSLTLGWTGTLSGTRGGTGVNNGASTITIGGSFAMSGAFTFTGTLTGNTAVTFPTSGTLATTSQIPTGAPLTKTDDTNVTLTLGGSPTTALVNAASLTLGWTGTLAETRGGTNQSTYTLGDTLYSSAANTLSKLAGNITTIKQFLSQTGTGAVSAAPAWATITGADVTGAALTKTDDTNVTLTLGGTPSTALLKAASLTLGWTGQLSLTRGGTNASLTASNGGIFYSTSTAGAILAGTATANQVLLSGTSAAPSWSTATYPATTTINQLLFSSAANTIAGITTANDGVLITSNTGVPSWLANSGTAGFVLTANSGAPPSWQAGTSLQLTAWQAYTPTITGFGTPTSVEIWSRRVGDTLEIRGGFTSGTSTGVEARLTLGYLGTNANVTSSNTKITSIQYAGSGALSVANAPSNNTLIEANVGYITFGIQGSGIGGLNKLLGSSMLASGNRISFLAAVPVDSFP
jgi:hypothetical protein